MLSSEMMLETAVKAADDKRAEDIVVLDMREVSLLADYFVILSGNSERQLQAIVDAVQDKEEEAGVMVRHIEGQKNSKWVLMDFGDVVVNAFLPEEREFYNLEKLWRDAPLVDVEGWIEG